MTRPQVNKLWELDEGDSSHTNVVMDLNQYPEAVVPGGKSDSKA